jgi:hypothetical protein
MAFLDDEVNAPRLHAADGDEIPPSDEGGGGPTGEVVEESPTEVLDEAADEGGGGPTG